MGNQSLAISELRELEDLELDLGLNISNNTNTKKTMNKNDDSSSKEKQHLKQLKVYVCDFCSKKFPTCQALGGHQNGHKTERAMMKRRRSGVEQQAPEVNRFRYDCPINRIGYYQPLSSSNISNTQSSTSNHYDLSRDMIDNFRAYRTDVRPPRKSSDEEKSLKAGVVDLNLKLWFK